MFILEKIEILNSYEKWEIVLSVKYHVQDKSYVVTSGYNGVKREFKDDTIRFTIRKLNTNERYVVNSVVDYEIYNEVKSHQVYYYSSMSPVAYKLSTLLEYEGKSESSNKPNGVPIVTMITDGIGYTTLFGSILLDPYSLLVGYFKDETKNHEGRLYFYSSSCYVDTVDCSVWSFRIKDQLAYDTLRAKYLLMNT